MGLDIIAHNCKTFTEAIISFSRSTLPGGFTHYGGASLYFFQDLKISNALRRIQQHQIETSHEIIRDRLPNDCFFFKYSLNSIGTDL